MPEPSALYRLLPVEAPWGDRGYVLMHGMTSPDRLHGLIQLERTGPHIAPITFPGDGIVVTQAFQLALEQSGLRGFSFQPVIKRRIVNLAWEEWEITAEEPEEEPMNGDPENYIFARPHETWVADDLGILMEMVLEPGVEAQFDTEKILRMKPESWNGADFFYAEPYRFPCVSTEAREWLQHHAGDYVEFRELRT